MQIRTGLIALILTIVLLLSSSSPSVAADRMTYDEYLTQLKSYQDREARANESIAEENKIIEDLRRQISEVNQQIENKWNQIFAELGITRAEYEQYLSEIAAVGDRISKLERLSPDKLLERADELDELDARIAELSNAPAGQLSYPKGQLSDLKGRNERLRKALPKPKNDSYTVVRGDHLWRISGRKAIFNDPWKWMRIYSANRETIKDPDLIYPEQRLVIPRQLGRDDHLVARGEYLSKIAGYAQVYGDPFKWTKIYQANKADGFIQDPNLIYPEQILSIPRN